MPEEQVFQIILLPREDYWSWVQAIRDYVVQFGIPVTPTPDNAADFHRPQQTVTVINFPDAYPEQGDIADWFAINAPDVKLDIIEASSPETLRGILMGRITSNERFGTTEAASAPQPAPPAPAPAPVQPVPGAGPGIALQWPTDHDYVTQAFGINPDAYRRFGLPGHEGIDIRAPRNSNIYACADGVVIRAERDPGSGAYGMHVRIRHAGGYKTVYAHLIDVKVSVNDQVKAGQLIGLADNTGNSFGDHLHLTLKLEGATAAGQTNYPYDIIDPTPFLIPFDETPRPEQPPAPTWAFDKCLVGVHGRADGPMEEADWPAVESANVEALKLLSWARGEDVDRAREINPNMFIPVRAKFSFGHDKISPQQFVETVAADLERHYDRGIRYIEVHNEPNITIEGWGTSWRDGSQFAAFFLESVELLKQHFPEAKYGWPGCSPGPGIDGQRFYMWDFIRGAREAIEAADWLGVHCYWRGANDQNVFAIQTGLEYQAFRDQWPDKLILITEFSNTSQDVDKAIKARQYVKYFQHLRNQPNVGAAFSFVVSASSYFRHEVWRSEGGRLSAIPGAIGARPAF